MIIATLALAATLHAPVDYTPPCKYEDGSSQSRCVWDAKHMGNGTGKSFVIRNGGEDNAKIRYVSHKRAHKLFSTNR